MTVLEPSTRKDWDNTVKLTNTSFDELTPTKSSKPGATRSQVRKQIINISAKMCIWVFYRNIFHIINMVSSQIFIVMCPEKEFRCKMQ